MNLDDLVLIDFVESSDDHPPTPSRVAGWVLDMDDDRLLIAPDQPDSPPVPIRWADVTDCWVLEHAPDVERIDDPTPIDAVDVWQIVPVRLGTRTLMGYWDGASFMYRDRDQWFRGQSDGPVIDLRPKPLGEPCEPPDLTGASSISVRFGFGKELHGWEIGDDVYHWDRGWYRTKL